MKKIDWQTISNWNVDIIHEGSFAFMNSVEELEHSLCDSALLDGFMIIFVTDGEFRITIDDQDYTLTCGDIASCRPKNIIDKLEHNRQASVKVLYGTNEFGHEVGSLINLDWTSSSLHQQTHRIVHPSDKEFQFMIKLLELIKLKMEASDSSNKRNCLLLLLSALTFQMSDIGASTNKTLPQKKYSPGEHLVERFLDLLNDMDHPYVSVAEYAEELCVTPKYFSSVCKATTGKTASEIINDAIIKSAQILLRNNNLSIRQISEKLNFANQSHFGRFFVRHIGLSPQKYRDSQGRYKKKK